MTNERDDLYSQADYQPITDEHFLRRCSATVEVLEDEPEDNDDWQDIQQLLN